MDCKIDTQQNEETSQTKERDDTPDWKEENISLENCFWNPGRMLGGEDLTLLVTGAGLNRIKKSLDIQGARS